MNPNLVKNPVMIHPTFPKLYVSISVLRQTTKTTKSSGKVIKPVLHIHKYAT